MHMTYLRAVLGIGILGAALAACDGDGETTGSGATTTTAGNGGTTSTSTSTGGGGTGGTTSTGGGGTGGTGGTTSTGGSGGTTSTEGGGGTGGTTTTSTGPKYGFCAQPCAMAVDCCPANAVDCPSDTYPNNYQCADGACSRPSVRVDGRLHGAESQAGLQPDLRHEDLRVSVFWMRTVCCR